MIVLLWSLAALAQDACPDRSSPDELRELLDKGEKAYEDLDPTGFDDALDQATIILPCLDEPISGPLAGEYHFAQGLRKYIARDEEGAKRAFMAARSANPGMVFPARLAPEGNTLRADWDAAVPSLVEVRLPPPAEGQLYVDGLARQTRPADRPYVLQIVSGNGHVVLTAWLQPDDALQYQVDPKYVPAAPVAAAKPKPSHPMVSKPLALAAGGAAVASVGAYVLAGREEAAFQAAADARAPWDEVEGKAHATNGLAATAGGLGVTAIGLVTASFLVVRF